MFSPTRPLRHALLFVLVLWCHSAVAIKPVLHGLPETLQTPIGVAAGEWNSDDPQDIKRLKKRIVQGLESYGYYSAEVTLAPDAEQISAQIALGEPVTVQAVNITFIGDAQSDPEFQSLQAKFPLKKGDRLLHAPYEAWKSALQQLAQERGYFDATQPQGRIEVSRKAHSATIKLAFSSGKRHKFGPVDADVSAVKPELLKELAPFKEGQDYDAELLADYNQTLRKTGYFSSIRAQPVVDQVPALAANGQQHPGNRDNGDSHDGEIPIHIEAEPRKEYIGQVGIGASTDQGVHVSAQLQRPHINQYGHSASAKMNLSQLAQSLSVDWRVPRTPDPEQHFWAFQAGFQNDLTTDIETRVWSTSATLHDVTESGWQRALFLRAERYSLIDEFDNDTLVSRDINQVTPGISLTRTRKDEEHNHRPQHGSKIVLELSASSQELLSDVDMLRASASGNLIVPVGESDRLIARGQLGALYSSAIDDLPPSNRFFSGGDRSTRGYRFQQVSPADEFGGRIGGAYLAAGSLEYEHQLNDSWGVAGFVDAAHVARDDVAVDALGIGVGVRWYSPIGPVRLDAGIGLTDDAPDYQIHFTIGPDL